MRNRKLRWILKGLSVLCCAVMLGSSVQLAAERPAFAYADVDAIQAQIDALEKRNSGTQDKLDSLQSDIAAKEQEKKLLEDKRKNAHEQVVLYAQKLGILAEEIAQNIDNIADKETDIENHTELFGQRVRAMYMSSQTSPLELLLRSKSFSEFLSQAETLRRISEYDSNLIDTLSSEKEELCLLRDDLDKQQGDAELTRQKYLDKVTELDFDIDEVETSKGELKLQQEEYLANIAENEKKAAEFEKQAEALIKKHEEEERKRREEEERRRREEEERRRQEEENNKKPDPSDTEDKPVSPGTERGFIWPLPASARITSYFGPRTVYGRYNFHGGLDIAAPRDSAIIAAKSGTVIAAGPSGTTYGNYVIISHGDGYSTLYAHCGNVYARSGQYVRQGEKVAGVGLTGRTTGYHLHFEVRKNGVRVNPLSFVSKPW